MKKDLEIEKLAEFEQFRNEAGYNHFQNTKFDTFAIMLNHFHVIIRIINTVWAGSPRPNENGYGRISEYIENNPLKWELDFLNPGN